MKPWTLQLLLLLVSCHALGVSEDFITSYTVHVPADFTTIQEAVDAAGEGCKIVVSPGTYFENIELTGKNVVLASKETDGNPDPENTIIDGGGIDSVITFNGDELTTCALIGFTIQNGIADSGGGINGKGALAAILNNNIFGNIARTSGGGIFNCNGLIENNTIHYNASSNYGGGLSFIGGNVRYNTIYWNTAFDGAGIYQCFNTIQGNIIQSNECPNTGGGIKNSTALIMNNIIIDNTGVQKGGGLSSCDGDIVNNTILNNSSVSGAGLHDCRGFIANNIIYGNTPGDQIVESSLPFYSCIQGTHGGRGNISLDPMLDGDYTPLPGSPCIDAGLSYYLHGDFIADQGHQCRIAGASVDMGARETGSAPDEDGDLLTNEDELVFASNPDEPDTDGDGLMDGVERLRGTNPLSPDEPTTTIISSDEESIQKSLFLAFPGEHILVSPGFYRENIHFLNKNILLEGQNPEDEYIVRKTILNGSFLHSVITLGGKEGEASAIRGVRITGGRAFQGGGIAGNDSWTRIENNIIEDNLVRGDYSSGGGIHGCRGTIQGNRIEGNEALGLGASGGGLASCRGDILENIITGNIAYRHGGGLVLCGLNGAIAGNVISFNLAVYGGGLSSCSCPVYNNIFYGNGAANLGGALHASSGPIFHNTIFGNIALVEGGGLAGCRDSIRNCIIWGNDSPESPQLPLSGPSSCSVPDYSCIEGWPGGGSGNLSTDPRIKDPPRGDFHLESSSPCIDAGGLIQGLVKDFEGDLRPFHSINWEERGDGSFFDMGADEFPGIVPPRTTTPTPTPSPSPTPYLVREYDFDENTEGWMENTIPERYTKPSFSWIPGALGITVTDNTQNYGYWESPEDGIPLETGYIYRARFQLSTNIPDPARVPLIRLRTLSSNAQVADVLEISSREDGLCSPGPVPAPCDLMFTPPLMQSSGGMDAAPIRLSFDLANFDTADSSTGTVYLSGVRVERFDPGAIPFIEGMNSWDFESPGSGDWIWNEVPEFFTPPIPEETAVGLKMTGSDDRTYGFWSTAYGRLSVKSEVMYRCSAIIATGVEERTRAPGFRLRFNSEGFHWAFSREIYSAGAGENSPVPGGTPYTIFFIPHQKIEPSGAVNLMFSFDMKSFDKGDDLEGWLLLKNAAIDLMERPD